jgi:hypothetical protein
MKSHFLYEGATLAGMTTEVLVLLAPVEGHIYCSDFQDLQIKLPSSVAHIDHTWP